MDLWDTTESNVIRCCQWGLPVSLKSHGCSRLSGAVSLAFEIRIKPLYIKMNTRYKPRRFGQSCEKTGKGKQLSANEDMGLL